MKKMFAVLLTLALCLALTACGGKTTTASTSAQASTEPISLRFYGNIVEDASTSEKLELAKKHFEGKYNIEEIQVDWSNIETVIKTGIASDDPADIYFYWPQDMRKLTSSDSALDLTPYLTANNNEWLSQFDPSVIDIGKVDGKYYNIPYMMQSSTVIVNDTLAKELGIEVPDRPTWEEFEEICKQAKAKGVTPFALDGGWSGFFMRNGMLSLANDADKLEALSKGQVPATDPIITTALTRAVDMYKNNYLYPGEGAFTTTLDEAKMAFAQKKILMAAAVFSITGDFQKIADENGFEVRAISWPRMGKESTLLGGGNGFFIPSNAKNPDAAIEFLKFYTGPECAEIDAKYGMVPACNQVKFENKMIQSILANLDGIYPYELMNLNPELGNYLEKECIQSIGLGQATMEQALSTLQEHLDKAQ